MYVKQWRDERNTYNEQNNNSYNSSRYDTFQEPFERNKKTYSLYEDC